MLIFSVALCNAETVWGAGTIPRQNLENVLEINDELQLATNPGKTFATPFTRADFPRSTAKSSHYPLHSRSGNKLSV